jgi:hypothetical protein
MAPSTPDHAFVVLAYERSPFLSACLASLENQTITSRVLIATSTPNADISEQAQRYDADLKINPQRSGMAGDFNFGLGASGARFVTLVHQDDLYEPTFLARTLGMFARQPSGALNFTGYREIDDAGQVRRSKISIANDLLTAGTLGRTETLSRLRSRLFLGLGCAIPCSSVTYDLQKLGDFRFSSELSCCLDWDAWWRLRQSGHVFLRTPERLVHRRYNGQTATSQAKREGRRQSEDLAILRAIWPSHIADLVHRVYSLGY